MTPEHEEAVRLAKKHGARVAIAPEPFPNAIVFGGPHELAALIAEVRRQKGEEDAAAVMKIAMKHCNKQQTEYFDDIGPELEMAAEAIRARLDSPMGKEEGK